MAESRGGYVSPEEQSIIDNTKANGTYLLAPNGRPTNLTPRQWVQVRTEAFKQWFGDWEKQARINKLRNSTPINIVFDNQYDLNRDSAKQWMKDNIRGEYTNKDTGETIQISKVGANKVTSHGEKDIAHLQSIVAIPQLIENAIYIDEQQNEKGNEKYDSYRYYVCGAKINGEDYTIKVVIGVKGDSKYYDHRLTQIEKGILIDNLNAMANHVAENLNASYSMGKDSKLLSILQTNASKIVDENGEPRIMYHGTDVDITTFLMQDGSLGRGAYFTSNWDEAAEYAKEKQGVEDIEDLDESKVLEVFLNVRDENNITHSRFYRGDIEVLATTPNQIKSATDNIGTFDNRLNDIRFRNSSSASHSEDRGGGRRPEGLNQVNSPIDTARQVASQDIPRRIEQRTAALAQELGVPITVLHSNDQLRPLGDDYNYLTDWLDGNIDGRPHRMAGMFSQTDNRLFVFAHNIIGTADPLAQLESTTHQAAVRLTWNNEKKNWLLTAFEKKNSAFDNTMDTGETSLRGKQNDTATLQNTVSNDKDTTNSQTSNNLQQKIAQAEAEVNTNPTEAQKEAGNYKKGHIRLGAFDITIEQPQGSIRRGVDANGKSWESKMHNTYGYIRGTEGVDGDHIDVFLSNDINRWNGEQVFVIDQYNEDGTFDEHKVMLGFNDIDQAYQAYLSNYEKGWEKKHKIVITATTTQDFSKWIDSSHRKTKAFADYKSVKTTEGQATSPAQQDLPSEGQIGEANPPSAYSSSASHSEDRGGGRRPEGVNQDNDSDVDGGVNTTGAVGGTATNQQQPSAMAGTTTPEQARQLHDRVAQWESTLQVPIHIVNTPDEITNHQARTQILAGNKIYGWYDDTDSTVYLYAPACIDDINETDKTILHEVVAHKGVRALFKEEAALNRLYDYVWEMMSIQDKKRIIRYPGVTHLRGQEAQRAAADEYIAELAEQISISTTNTDIRLVAHRANLWNRIITFLRLTLRQAGIKLHLNNSDINNILISSYNKLRNNTSRPSPSTQETELDIFLRENRAANDRHREQWKSIPRPRDLEKAYEAGDTQAIEQWKAGWEVFLQQLIPMDIPIIDGTISTASRNKAVKMVQTPQGYKVDKESSAYKAFDYIEKSLKKRKRQLEHNLTEDERRTIDIVKRGLRGELNNTRLRAVSEAFDSQLQQQIDGTLPAGHIYNLGMPGPILRSAGLPNLPIELAASRLTDKSMQENHPFDIAEVRGLVDAIQDPLAIFRSATHIGSFVVLTEIQHGGRNFVVAIEANRRQGRIEVNSIRSVYPKNNKQVANWIEDGLLEYAHKERMSEWFSKQQSNSADVRKLFRHTAKIVQNFENPKLPDTRFRAVGDMEKSYEISDINGTHKVINLLNDEQTAQFFIVSNEYNKEQVDKLNEWLKQHKDDYVRLYHGTNSRNNIKEEGILKTTKTRRNSYQSESGYVYLSLYPSSARMFGEIASPYYGATVYSVDVQIKELKPDTDQLNNKRIADSNLANIGNTLADSLIYGNGARVKRAIAPYELNSTRFRFIGEQGAANLDRAEEATTRLDNLAIARDMEQAIIDNAKANGTYLLAPNGRPTNLTPRQWVQVRTKAFKEWFGDWQKAARIEKLRNSEPVSMTGNEYKGKYELNRDSAQNYILNNLRGYYDIADTKEHIKIAKKGAKKVTSHSISNEVHLKSIAIIPEIINSSVFITELPAEKNDAQYDSYRYYVCGLDYNGESYTVKMTIGVKNGDFYYDHALTEVEKGKLLDLIESNQAVNREGFTPTGDAPIPSYALSKVKDSKLLSILQTNASKIVDENGEPMVVYRGTPQRMGYTFEYGHNFYGGNKGFWFTTAKTAAKDYSFNYDTGFYGEIKEVFLNIRNPMDLMPLKRHTTSKRFYEFIKQNFNIHLGRGSSKEYPTHELYEKFQDFLYPGIHDASSYDKAKSKMPAQNTACSVIIIPVAELSQPKTCYSYPRL